ncbi:MAG TPA: tetratricopeptide repeat protein [Thermoanaerobaculia bacterium]|nr:tetratricopeptide repeat protein [Thermoanaerobaculia bacterium]
MSWYANCIHVDAEDWCVTVNEDPLFVNLGGFSVVRRSSPHSWGLCESLIARSQACRYRDPEQMVLLAQRAVAVAEGLDPMEYGKELVADLRARAFAELANAHRVADDLDAAERMLRRAADWNARGTQDPLLLARIMRLAAAQRGAQRRFPEALALLDAVFTIYERHGDRSNAGRALISKGLYTGYSNDPETAIQLLYAGLAMVNPASDPALVLSAVHNLVNFLTDCGRFQEARRILRRSRRAYVSAGDRLNLIKLRWVEGKIAAGLGEHPRAVAALREARAEFESMNLSYHAALVSLDLTSILLETGKTGEARELVGQMIAIFRSRRIAREVLAALLMLKRSLDGDRDSLELLRTVRGYFQRLEARPGI